MRIHSKLWPLKQSEFVNFDIVRALREKGLWNANLVPIEILMRDRDTQRIQRQRVLFQSMDVEQTRVGYLNHIEVEDDPNAFPMGILLSKKIPTELLKYLKFPVFIRRRNDYKTGKDLSEYASFVHQQLNKLEDIHGIIEEETEQKAEQPGTKTGMEPERRRTGQRATLRVSSTNNVICVDLGRFQMLKLKRLSESRNQCTALSLPSVPGIWTRCSNIGH